MANKPNIRFKGFTDDWEQRKLGEVVEFLDTMRKPLEGTKRVSGPYPYYGASGIVDYVDDYIFDEELILLSEDGANITDRSYPVCFLVSGKYWVNNHAHVLRIKSGNESSFICNSLERKDYKQFNTGMAMPKLNQEVCRKIPVICPSFEEQIKIGDYFKNLDHLITLHQRKCDETKKLKKFMLQKMFPKNGEKNPEIRFAGFTDDWEQRKLGDIGSVVMCRRIFKYQTTDYGEIPFFKIGTFGGTPDAYISRELFDEFKTKYPYPDKGDILISASGSIGRTVVFTGNDEYFQDSNIVWLKHNKTVINPFLRHLYEVVEWAGIEGSTIKRLYNDNILKTEIIIPSVLEQDKIAKTLDGIDHLITLHQRKCDKLKLIKKFMLQNMFPKKG